MFKYKSPLSRLLEGAGKPQETETEEVAAPESDNAEPIADFNALRNALAGGNTTADSYDESEELLPEDKMPEFSEAEQATADEIIVEEVVAEVQSATEVTVDADPKDDEPVVTLHVSTEELTATIADPAPEMAMEEPVVDVVVETVDPEPEAPSAQEVEVQPQPAPAAKEDRRSRVKTTFLGFERADTHVQDLMESAEPVAMAKTEAAQATFPVGWLVVTSGPGRGSSVTLTEGLMQIGRNDDQAIQLDFGDTGISRSNHAVIAYDPEDRKCYLGHGGKANLVRLNGKPVLSTVPLSTGDLIRISETSIRFAAFCDDGFDWRDA
ncbi:FHA domain-containing protein [Ruegeria faecimaris]|uniref:FHA domain-containing protein n=1 Tax=Ruegeria faecimaris TaxID=686389 RepID=UPI00232AAFC9|nr:FHA domain-containing protein [Ruegeria faecimaris]